MNAAEPVRDKRKVREMTNYFLKKGSIRNYTLLIMGFHTALRIGDILRLRWCDVFDYDKKKIRGMIMITEKKTKKSKSIALHKSVFKALKLLYNAAQSPDGDRFVFENKRTGQAISRIQAYRITREAAVSADLSGTISCHSLRKTFGYHAWKNKVPLAIIMEIYNHSSFAVTKRYLGVTQDDKNSVYLRLDFV